METKDEQKETKACESKIIHKQSKVKKIFNILTKVVLLLLIIAAIIISIRAVVYKKYDIFGYRFIVIMSGSMQPAINTKDLIITKDIDSPQVGDIIAFQDSNTITVHRIINSHEENGEMVYQTKGDYNNTPDPQEVRLPDIKGKVVYTIPKVGNAIEFLKSHLIILLIYLIAIIIIIALIRRLI